MPEIMQQVSQKLIDAIGSESVDEMLRKSLDVPIEASLKLSKIDVETPQGVWVGMRNYLYQWEAKRDGKE